MAIVLCIPIIIVGIVFSSVNKKEFYQQKERSLFILAEILEKNLGPGGYNEILERELGPDYAKATDKEKLAVLNAALAPFTDDVAYSDIDLKLGIGYYSKELDMILTYGPSEEIMTNIDGEIEYFKDTVGRRIGDTHKGRIVMETGEPLADQAVQVRGYILNCMIPIIREDIDGNEEIIGYIWSNETVDDLNAELSRILSIFIISLAVLYLVIIGVSAALTFSIVMIERRTSEKIRKTSEELIRLNLLMNTMNIAISKLITSVDENFETALDECMKTVTKVFEFNCIQIYKYNNSSDNMNVVAMYNIDVSDYQTNEFNVIRFFSSEDSTTSWNERLSSSEIIKAYLNELSGDNKAKFEECNLKSVILIPTFIQKKLWGMVVCFDNVNEKLITSNEENILVSSSLLFTDAIARNDLMNNLVKARQEALEGTKAKSAFLANMSHEIRTPMNAIIGMAQLARVSNNNEFKHNAFIRINENSTHLLGVINDILDISKIEAGKLELDNGEFKLEGLFQKIASINVYKIEEKKQHFYIEIDPSVPLILDGDEQKLSQVITNILSNAIKFTPENGTIIIKVSCVEEVEETVTLKIEINDTGIGMSENQINKIFIAFEQAETTTTRKFGGTGLGLTISKKIIEMMNGAIWVESEIGVGSTFHFTVKMKKVLLTPSKKIKFEDKRILIIDKDERAINNLCNIVDRFEIDYVTSNDINKIVFDNKHFDVAFVDWQSLNPGDEYMLKDLRDKGIVKEVILIISSVQWTYVESTTRELGFNSFINKPILASTFYESLLEGLHVTKQNKKEDESIIPNLEGKTLLVVDDVDINREIIKLFLEETKAIIDMAENGEVAVNKFKENSSKYSIILMDIQMPVLDGYDATRMIRTMDRKEAQTIPIIAMTANVLKEDIEKCLSYGMNDHIGKPIILKGLYAVIKKYIN